MLHGLDVRPELLRVLDLDFIDPLRLEPTVDCDDLAQHPRPHERRAPDPRPEQRAPQWGAYLIREDRLSRQRRPNDVGAP